MVGAASRLVQIPSVSGSDLRLLVNQGRIPTLQYGPGDAMLAHAPDESVPVDDMAMTARTLASLALDICGVA